MQCIWGYQGFGQVEYNSNCLMNMIKHKHEINAVFDLAVLQKLEFPTNVFTFVGLGVQGKVLRIAITPLKCHSEFENNFCSLCFYTCTYKLGHSFDPTSRNMFY